MEIDVEKQKISLSMKYVDQSTGQDLDSFQVCMSVLLSTAHMTVKSMHLLPFHHRSSLEGSFCLVLNFLRQLGDCRDTTWFRWAQVDKAYLIRLIGGRTRKKRKQGEISGQEEREKMHSVPIKGKKTSTRITVGEPRKVTKTPMVTKKNSKVRKRRRTSPYLDYLRKKHACSRCIHAHGASPKTSSHAYHFSVKIKAHIFVS